MPPTAAAPCGPVPPAGGHRFRKDPCMDMGDVYGTPHTTVLRGLCTTPSEHARGYTHTPRTLEKRFDLQGALVRGCFQ